MSYIQFRLSNGDEIVAQVIQEPTGEDINIVVKNAMMIIRAENIAQGIRYYSFRPWMSYQLDDEYFQLLNFNHIIGEAKPDADLLEQYKKALTLEKDCDRVDDDGNELKNLRKMVKSMKNNLFEVSDSDTNENNVIHWNFDKSTMH